MQMTQHPAQPHQPPQMTVPLPVIIKKEKIDGSQAYSQPSKSPSTHSISSGTSGASNSSTGSTCGRSWYSDNGQVGHIKYGKGTVQTRLVAQNGELQQRHPTIINAATMSKLILMDTKRKPKTRGPRHIRIKGVKKPITPKEKQKMSARLIKHGLQRIDVYIKK